MTSQVIIRIGGIIQTENHQYRVIGIQHGVVALCEMNVSRLILVYKKFDDLDNLLIKNEASFLESDNDKVIDISLLSKDIQSRFDANKEMIKTVQEKYGPMYECLKNDRNSHFISGLSKEFGIEHRTVLKWIRIWLQSGMDETSLIDKRATRYLVDKYVIDNGKVRKAQSTRKQNFSEVDFKNVDKYFKLYQSQKYTLMTHAYFDMLNDCYRVHQVKDNTEIVSDISKDAPSYQQFRRYCINHLTAEQRDAIKMNAREQRNNKRILKGSSMTGVSYAGEAAEIDEVDNPISLVSVAKPEITVGRPNTYLMIDIKSRVILAIGVALNQNSYVGLTNMMINLAEDKVEYCKRYGIDIKAEEWPSCIIPARIRTDRGSDFKGNDFLKVCKRIGIERNLEPAATGSMKGLVENSFRVIQPQERSIYQGIGQITKDYGSKHHENAMLNIDEYTRQLLLLVIEHNKKSMADYPLTPDMLAKGIKPRPYELWKYFSEYVQAPMPIQNKNSYLVSLMKDGKASINRKGIHFLKRTYFPNTDEADLYDMMYRQQGKNAYISIKYDPRNMNHIYILRNQRLIVLAMSKDKPENIGYFNLSEQEVEMLNKQANEIRREEAQYNRQLQADTRLFSKKGIEASYKDLKPSVKNLRENRKNEKSAIANNNYSIAERLGITDNQKDNSNTVKDKQIDKAELKKPTVKKETIQEDEDSDLNELMSAIGEVNSK